VKTEKVLKKQNQPKTEDKKIPKTYAIQNVNVKPVHDLKFAIVSSVSDTMP